MPSRFSDWAKERRNSGAGVAQPEVTTTIQRFLVDNSLLRSDSSGLRYRASPDGEKNRTVKPVAWGRCVYGALNEAGTWLKVKPGRYLPVMVQGHCVLKLQLDDPEPFEDDMEEVMWIEPLKAVNQAVNQAVAGPGSSRGSCYEISAEKAALRRGPSFNANTIVWLPQGETVELFGWDESWQWRQCWEPRKKLLGWLLLARDGEAREGVAPLVQPRCRKPWRPEPLCDAAAEGRLSDLRHLLKAHPAEGGCGWPRDLQNHTPLQLSVLHHQLPCAVRLLEAGADAEEALCECEQRGDELDDLSAALLGAFALDRVLPSDATLQLALKKLDPAERSAALTQLQRRWNPGSAKSEDGASGSSASTENGSSPQQEGESHESHELEVSDSGDASSQLPSQRHPRLAKRRSSLGARGHRFTSRVSSSSSESEVEVKTAEAFRSWLDGRPSMCRLSAVRSVDTGIAWDFPLTKSEKRELLLMYVAEGEKMAEESACQALYEERRQRKSLESAKAALARIRKRTLTSRRRSKPGRRSLGGPVAQS